MGIKGPGNDIHFAGTGPPSQGVREPSHKVTGPPAGPGEANTMPGREPVSLSQTPSCHQ